MGKDRCEYCYRKKEDGCGLTDDVLHQAVNGGCGASNRWPEKRWNSYIKRVKKVVSSCHHPGELEEAIDMAQTLVDFIKEEKK